MSSTKINPAIPAPAAPTFATATTGGTVAAGTWFYKVSAIMSVGPGGPIPGVSGSIGYFESLPSTEASQVTTGSTSTVTVNWVAVAGATGYRIYGRSATGVEKYLVTVGNVATWLDDGSVTPTASVSPLGASTALAGNCFLPGSSLGQTMPPGNVFTAPAVQTPFTAGRKVTLVNMTGGSIAVTGSDDGVTFSALATVATLGMVDVTLPNFVVAASAGLYALAGA